jgi:hypothetical protein
VHRDLRFLFTPQTIASLTQEDDSDNDGRFDFNDFLTVFAHEKDSGKESELWSCLCKHQELKTVAGLRGDRSSDHVEVTAYAEDPDDNHVVPINTTDGSLFKVVHDSILLYKVCELASPGCIDRCAIATGEKLSIDSLLQQCTLAVVSAKSIGATTSDIRPNDVRDGTLHLVFECIRQLFLLALMKDIELAQHPELVRLLKEAESIGDLIKLSPEQFLLRWLTDHIGKAGSDRVQPTSTRIFPTPRCSPSCSTRLHRTAIGRRSMRPTTGSAADEIGCRKFIRPRQIVGGHPTLNLAFVLK